MAKKKNCLGILAIALVFGALFIGCSQKNPLIGTWSGSNYGMDSEITFGSDGSYTDKSEIGTFIGTYSVKGNTLMITVGEDTVSYDFEIEEDRFTYIFGAYAFTFTKE